MSTKTKTSPEAEFHWECQPAAAAVVHELVDDFCERSPAALRLRERLLRETGTRFFDWVDHISLGDEADRAAIAGAGFEFSVIDGVSVAENFVATLELRFLRQNGDGQRYFCANIDSQVMSQPAASA